MTYLAVVLASVGSAAFFAVSTTLKHRSAGHVPDAQQLTPTQLGRFIGSTVTHRLWLGGIAADVGGLGLQVYALHVGALAIVQPVLISGLLFSLLLNHATADTRISRREFSWAAVLAASLVGFLAVSGVSNKTTTNGATHGADHGPAISAAALVVVIAAVLITLARRVPRGLAASMLGVTVGFCYAATASLIKSCSNIAVAGGLLDVLTSWQLYLLIAVGAAGMLLNQLAFQAGPLTASLPAIATVDPILSVAIGVWVYDERLNHSPLATVGDIALLLLLSLATIMLSRITAETEQVEQTH